MMLLFHAAVIMLPMALLFDSNSKLVATLTLTKDFPPLYYRQHKWPVASVRTGELKKGDKYLHDARNLRDE
jgi:hypothetical protein